MAMGRVKALSPGITRVGSSRRMKNGRIAGLCGRDYGIPINEATYERVGEISCQDTVMYFSDGRLNKVVGVMLDNIFFKN